jgi:hypothetical protein
MIEGDEASAVVHGESEQVRIGDWREPRMNCRCTRPGDRRLGPSDQK